MGEHQRRIRLLIGYDGTDFCGWQVQPVDRSVQGEIEKALAAVHGHPVRLHGSGRTDTGVHATGQTAHFDTDIASIPADKFVPALNSRLPGDVRIYRSEEVSPDFHARYSALRRAYRYVVRSYASMTPMDQRFCLSLPQLPGLAQLNGYAAYLVGVHDFTTFTTAKDASESRVREIYQASWNMNGAALEFTICGNAFLWRMVRSLVGTMLDAAREGFPPEYMRDILASADRGRAGTTAPAMGLRLERVEYE